MVSEADRVVAHISPDDDGRHPVEVRRLRGRLINEVDVSVLFIDEKIVVARLALDGQGMRAQARRENPAILMFVCYGTVAVFKDSQTLPLMGRRTTHARGYQPRMTPPEAPPLTNKRTIGLSYVGTGLSVCFGA